MRIGIDTRTLLSRRGGITQYTYYLLKNLLVIDKANQYALFNYAKSQAFWNNYNSNFVEKVIRLPQQHYGNIIWEEYFLPYYIKKNKIDVMFSPDFYLSANIKCKKIVTIHDMIFGELTSLKETNQGKLMLKRVLKTIHSCDHIIVPSQFTKNDVLKYSLNEKVKISVIYEGVDEKFHIIDKEICKKVIDKYNIPEKYILFVGELNKRKNLDNAIRAFIQIKQDDKLKGMHFVAIGKKMEDTESILRMIPENLSLYFHFLGYIADEDIPYFYNCAELFIFISSFEGFGLPLVEAMACGTPVVCSISTSIPEIVGEAGFTINPDNPKVIYDAILEICENKNLRAILKEKGLKRASIFSWEKTANETLNVFLSCIDICG